MRVPFVDLKAQYHSLKPAIEAAMAEVMNETAFVGGRHVQRFESEFATALGVKHCISCANGTDSLFIILKMLGLGPGDEVITAANSWISSSETISLTGATPVFVDVHPLYASLDEQLLESRRSPRTRAVVAVHLHGQMCEMQTLVDFCERHGLYLIEDCAQAHLSEYHGQKAGLFGVAGSFSFYPGKNLGAYGDAGCIVTNDDELAERFTRFARHGALIKHQHSMEGINSRMDGLQAAILSVKLPHLEEWTRARKRCAQLYREALQGISEIRLPSERPQCRHTYHLFVIECPRRDQLMHHLARHDIEISIHYPTPLPLMPAYARLGHVPSDFPVAHRLSQEILSLPMFAELRPDQIEYVAQTIQSFYACNSVQA